MAEVLQNGLAEAVTEKPASSSEPTIYEELPFAEASTGYQQYRHAAHVMIYARDDRVVFGQYSIVANVMMQIRFDGTLGFSGGFLDTNDDNVTEGLNRELVEEINLDVSKHSVQQQDHVCSHVCHAKKLVLHFYALEVTVAEYSDIERGVFTADEWGAETFGILRVPLYTWKDGVRGLPSFLAGNFIGNSRQQLLTALIRRHILSTDVVELAVCRSKQM